MNRKLKAWQDYCQEEIICSYCKNVMANIKMDHLCYYVDGDYGIDFLCSKCSKLDWKKERPQK